MKDLFISDLHLSPERPATSRAFFDFLATTAREANNLYILGDLVEAWIGDDDPSPLARDLVAGLRRLRDSGTGLYFLHGNRDFLVGRRFARQTGATLLPEHHTLDTAEGKLLICHGDTLCTDDIPYQKFRKKVRNPLLRWLLAHLPLAKRQQIAADWRRKSRDANSNKPDNIMDVNSDTVDELMARYGATTLLHGHTHRPGVHQHSHGQRVVLGDWDELGWYAELTADGLTLESFPIRAS